MAISNKSSVKIRRQNQVSKSTVKIKCQNQPLKSSSKIKHKNQESKSSVKYKNQNQASKSSAKTPLPESQNFLDKFGKNLVILYKFSRFVSEKINSFYPKKILKFHAS